MRRRVHYLLVWVILLPGFASGQNLFDRLLGDEAPRNLGAGQAEFLDPQQAFRFFHEANAQGIVLSWDIAPGYYLYRDRFKLAADTDSLEAKFVGMPTGEMKDDPEFGRVEIYRDQVSFQALVTTTQVPPADSVTTVTYQGCAEDGICYPPIKKTIAIPANYLAGNMTDDESKTESIAEHRSEFTAGPSADPGTASSFVVSADRLASRLQGQSLLTTVAIFFGFGLLLSLTPCVFPMVPILSGIIVGQKAPVTTAKAFSLSLIYVLAMAVTYALVGVIAGLFGHNLQASFQQPHWIIGFSIVFVLLALSMFGFYNLELPQSWQTKLDQLSRSQTGGSKLGVAVMGVLSAIIVGPCVAPPFAAALLYLSHEGNPLIGGLALFSMGLGMGVLLIVAGTAAGRFVPSSGAWMNGVKQLFGVLLLGVAIWFLARILPGPLILAAWAALLIISAVYLGILEPINPRAIAQPVEPAQLGWLHFKKGVAALALAYGLILLLGAAVGAHNPLRPLAPLVAGTDRQSTSLEFVAIKSLDDLNRAVAGAERDGKRVMLDFYADWCVECKHLENNTFADPQVRLALSDTLLLRADVTANDDIDQALLKRFELFGPPAVLFFNPSGSEDRNFRVLGFLGPNKFLAHLNALKSS